MGNLKLGYKPTSNKHMIFKEFEKGKHPSELVKKYKIGYNTMMKYYEEWKICHRKKERLLRETDNYFGILAREGKGDNLEMQLRTLLRRLDAKPMEWWYHKKTVKDVWSAA